MSAALRKLFALSLTPLSIIRREQATYPGSQHYEIQKQVRDLRLTGTFSIDYHQGRERAVRWEATEHGNGESS